MILFLIAVVLNYGYFYWGYSVEQLIKIPTFSAVAQNLLTLRWLWEHTSIWDLIRICAMYYALIGLIGLAAGICGLISGLTTSKVSNNDE